MEIEESSEDDEDENEAREHIERQESGSNFRKATESSYCGLLASKINKYSIREHCGAV